MAYREVAIAKSLKLIEPGPLVLVATYDTVNDRPNVMTISWTMAIDWDGGIALTTGPWNYSYQALMNLKECVVCIPSASLVETVVSIGDVSGEEVDKFERFGLKALPARSTKAPLIDGCIGCIECEVEKYIEEYGIFILRASHVWIDDGCEDKRMIHAIGDGTFKADGETFDCRHLMADKLPPGV
ncbi:MAG: flavin reductase family protein [Bacteroidales bacterium]|nr:flavin reductase family protein [Bacteroidales bacterium]